MANETRPLVGIIMGSDSDWPTMGAAAETLAEFEVPFEVGVVSAHRTVRKMVDYAESAADRGIKAIIAGAGGAAHLPGMVAALTPLPVIGVPVPLKHLDGLDSLLSIVQMPAGVPVATVSVGGARNAGLLAVRILASADAELQERMAGFQEQLADSARAKRHRPTPGCVPPAGPRCARRRSTPWPPERRQASARSTATSPCRRGGPAAPAHRSPAAEWPTPPCRAGARRHRRPR